MGFDQIFVALVTCGLGIALGGVPRDKGGMRLRRFLIDDKPRIQRQMTHRHERYSKESGGAALRVSGEACSKERSAGRLSLVPLL